MNIKIKEKPANQKKNGKGPDRAHHKRDNWMASKRLKMYSIYQPSKKLKLSETSLIPTRILKGKTTDNTVGILC